MFRKYGKPGSMLLFVLLIITTSCEKKEAEEKKTTGEDYVLSTIGPNNESPVSADTVKLSEAHLKEVKARNLKLAIVFHDIKSDFSKALISGVKKACAEYNISIISISDADFDVQKQSRDFADAIAGNPDIIISIILDAEEAAKALQPAVEKNIKISLLSNLPARFKHGRDYAGIVTDDLFGMGRYIAEMIGNSFAGKQGKVVLMYHDAPYYVTNQRDQAVKTVLSLSYANIEILGNVGIANPADGNEKALQILKEYPEVQAIYVPWDTIAEDVVEACKEAGRDDVQIFTIDLGIKNALNMVEGGNVKGIVADLPFDMGQALTRLAVLAVLGEETPPFITVPAIKVNKENIEKKWPEALNTELPEIIKQAMQRNN